MTAQRTLDGARNIEKGLNAGRAFDAAKDLAARKTRSGMGGGRGSSRSRGGSFVGLKKNMSRSQFVADHPESSQQQRKGKGRRSRRKKNGRWLIDFSDKIVVPPKKGEEKKPRKTRRGGRPKVWGLPLTPKGDAGDSKTMVWPERGKEGNGAGNILGKSGRAGGQVTFAPGRSSKKQPNVKGEGYKLGKEE